MTPLDLDKPATISEFFTRLFSQDFMPHGHCYFWRSEILWLHVISDVVIFLSYFSIPVTLIYFVVKKKEVPFNWVFWMFGAFIMLCGTTHIMDVYTTWSASYRLEGIIKALTAVVSIATAVALIPLVPKALALPGLKTLNDELEEKNRDLTLYRDSTTGRENRIIELKQEVNRLCRDCGRKPTYTEIL